MLLLPLPERSVGAFVAVAALLALPVSEMMEPALDERPAGTDGTGGIDPDAIDAWYEDGNDAADSRLGKEPMLLRRSLTSNDVRGDDVEDIDGPMDDGGLATPVADRGADSELAKLVVEELGLE